MGNIRKRNKKLKILQTPETMQLFGSTKKINRQNKNGEKAPSLEAV